ncbi:hypothetical protein HPB50_024035 [Hyalomma asiaticum]|uniref:Uncharacterized protein n=1 Tax=Hyalomma asiaticum TaxID=266040 RepID=A0ACB7RP44_HYAAI|nr:hypothetical protein HPB50_024035 [Hyalomma asiaticum]
MGLNRYYLSIALLSSTIRYSLANAPPSIRSFSFPSEIALGEEVIVVCSVKKGSSSDSYSISWQKDGRAVSETGRLSNLVETLAPVTLFAFKAADYFNYTTVLQVLPCFV